MLKALLKKQLAETALLFTGRRKKKAGKKISFGTAALLIFVYAMMFFLFWMVADQMCAPMTELGLDWFYFAMMGLISLALGVFGSVFSTYAALYLPKDNETLLSMPIPPRYILLSRMMTVYLIGFFFQILVALPVLVRYFTLVPFRIGTLLGALLSMLLTSFLILILSCALGFVVAFIATRLKHKSIATVLLSLVFLGVYFYVYTSAFAALEGLLTHLLTAAESIRLRFSVLYHFGQAHLGFNLSLLLIAAAVLALLALTVILLSRSFIRLTTMNRGTAKAVYKETAIKTGSRAGALRRKELRRFLGSPTYLLNCGLGLLIMPIFAILMLVKADVIREILFSLLSGMDTVNLLPLAAAVPVCMLAVMNNAAAPSVSLEGRNIWVLQSLPVSAKEILRAKIGFQLRLFLPMTLIFTVVLGIVLRLSPVSLVLTLLLVTAFLLLQATASLALNLRFPRLDWINESMVVKQGLSVTLALFGGWILSAVLGAAGWLLLRLLPSVLMLLVLSLLLLAAAALLLRWIDTRGVRIFERL